MGWEVQGTWNPIVAVGSNLVNIAAVTKNPGFPRRVWGLGLFVCSACMFDEGKYFWSTVGALISTNNSVPDSSYNYGIGCLK